MSDLSYPVGRYQSRDKLSAAERREMIDQIAAAPQRLRDAGYAPFIAVLRANMRDAGALRIDHVMGLLRLYWVPAGAPPARGAYVQYPLEDLLGIHKIELLAFQGIDDGNPPTSRKANPIFRNLQTLHAISGFLSRQAPETPPHSEI